MSEKKVTDGDSQAIDLQFENDDDALLASSSAVLRLMRATDHNATHGVKEVIDGLADVSFKGRGRHNFQFIVPVSVANHSTASCNLSITGCICIKVPNPPQDLAMFEARLNGQVAAA